MLCDEKPVVINFARLYCEKRDPFTQPKLLERSFPVPSGITATGGTGSLF
jgi:hypothetical protein